MINTSVNCVESNKETVEFIDWLTEKMARRKPPSDLIYERGRFFLWNDNAEKFDKYEELTSEQLYQLWFDEKKHIANAE